MSEAIRIGFREKWRNIGRLASLKLETPVYIEVEFSNPDEFSEIYLIDLLANLTGLESLIPVSLRIANGDKVLVNTELLEAVCYAASELQAYVVLSIRKPHLLSEQILEEVVDIASTYKRKVCLEPSETVKEHELYRAIAGISKGILKMCFNAGRKFAEGYNANAVIRELVHLLGLLEIVYFSGFSKKKGKIPVFSPESEADVLKVLGAILESEYSPCIILEYGGPLESYLRDIASIQQLSLSFREKLT